MAAVPSGSASGPVNNTMLICARARGRRASGPGTGAEAASSRCRRSLGEAAAFGLGIFLYPPTNLVCDCPECAARPPEWRILVMGICESEELANGQTLAGAVEFSFLPLQAYVESGLEPGYLPVDNAPDVSEELELGRLAGLAAEAHELGVALYIYSPTEHEERWRVGALAGSSSDVLGFGETLAEAVEHAFLPLRRFAREGSA